MIGSVINSIEIDYLDHKFMAAASNNYDYNSGIVISADGLYKGNDFVDISRATMTLEGKQIRFESLSDGYFL